MERYEQRAACGRDLLTTEGFRVSGNVPLRSVDRKSYQDLWIVPDDHLLLMVFPLDRLFLISRPAIYCRRVILQALLRTNAKIPRKL
ncbi:c920eaa1-4472-448a-8177-d65ae47ad7dc [Sclerotinia trifoliorum]|uniref:C920eaa1-4472-448a-8177-d65ae47ad7dc n=1 Tax=Sclerotinia trifoliorum TaxID=28548 RepID=A0A8H2ZPS6_9HELO|nr:c920eaa1-4472-448a-8177-d65ae47ad7dc [Sclerotinia trifoliorum]